MTVDYAPNALGQPTKAGSFASGVSYWPNGAIKQFTYGNGIVHTMQQNARQLPERSTDMLGSVRPLDSGYLYDPNANVQQIIDYSPGNRRSVSMSYDEQDRLTYATSPMFGTAVYDYDVLDNLFSAQISGGNSARNYWYLYSGLNRLSSITNGKGGATIAGLEYDERGNLKNKDGVLYGFDFGNRLRSVSGNKGAYHYDGLGRRVLDKVNNIAKRSQYINAGQLVYASDARTNKISDYVYLGGSLVAIREQSTAGGAFTNKYQHTDALGSPVAVTNQSRAIIETSEYEPYGKVTNRADKDGPGYTGHVQDAATSMTYMQQRYYDPAIGASLSVDPVTAYDNGDMRFFNRYAYAFNNPYRFTDPDGRQSKESDEGNFWVGVFKGVRDNVAPLAHAMVDPDGTMIDPSYDRVGPSEGQVEQGGYKFGGALATAEGLKIPAKGAGGLVKSEVALTEAQAKNLARFEKKLPTGNTGTTVTQTGESVTFTSEVPGRVPGSKAIYEKGVDASGTTTSMQKTTVAPNGQVIHVKDKLN